ncbi:MAG: TIM-barrel domain-containing protein [Terracidiphilus sp.]|jgi:alpha-D-xyloside xylohydrolase
MSSFKLRALLVPFSVTACIAALTLPSLSNAQAIERSKDGVALHSASGTLRVTICSERVIHIFAGVTDEISKPIVPTVIRPCGGVPFTVSSGATTVSIKTSALRVEVDRATDSVRFLTAAGQPVLSEHEHDGRTITPLDVDGMHTYEIRQDFLLSPNEALYGLGQHQEGFLDLRDIPVRLLQANTNISIPFLISTNGYGLLWNNAALTDFNPPTEVIHLDENGTGTFQTGPEGEYGFLLSGNGRGKLQLSVNNEKVIDLRNMWLPWSAGGKIQLAANTSYKVTAETGGGTELSVRAPSDTMAFRSQVGQGIDYYFIYGPEPNQVVAEYREFTGAAPLLPRWAYGFWQCRERYSSQQQVLDTAAEFRKRNIPVDVLVQDWQYWGKYGWNAMRFDESSYPNPEEMMTGLHRQNFHMVISVWAKFGSETAVDHQFKDAHLLLTSAASTGEPGETREPENWADLFDPEAQKLYWSDIDHNLFSDGLDGWWLDASEPEGDPLKDDNTYLGPGRIVRNAYPLFETSAVYNGQRATTESKRVVILSRSAYAGQQRNASISWSGDISANWETLRRQIPAGLSFAMSGFPYWTTDIGGFFRPADQYTSADYHELLIRWFQFGTFCPIFRIHGYQSKTEMWNYGPEVEKILTEYDQLRYRLMPYIYSSAWGVTSRGEAVMQALPFVYPGELALRDVDDEFLFGNSLLVSPVTQPKAESRRVVLPAGNDWIDFWSGKSFHGGQTIVAAAPLNQIPILVKEGSIVPMGPVVQSTADADDPMEIRIYGGKDADFLLYEDSGDSYAYEHGARATIRLHWDDRRKTLSIGDRSGAYPGMRSEQKLHIVLVKEEHGIGIGPESEVDRTATYAGHQITIVLRKAG